MSASTPPNSAGDAGSFAEQWRQWQQNRLAGATAPHGPAALTLTHWVSNARSPAIDGVPGSWLATERGIQGTGLAGAGLTVASSSDAGFVVGDQIGESVELAQGGVTELRDGDRLLRLFERDGVFALRIFDPLAPGRTGLVRIDAYDPSDAWSVPARFEDQVEAREIELADGYQRTVNTSGALVFEIGGTEYRLTATRGPAGLSIVFGDTTNGDETYGFRFLSTDLPGPGGEVVLDFNRAFLPPCAFSSQFVCPLPTPENRLPLAILAGEKQVILAE